MYANSRQAINGAQRWFNLAIRYQTKAEKMSQKYSDPSMYPDSIFACYRGYSHCMQMYDACWSYIDRCNEKWFKKQLDKQIEEEIKEKERIEQRIIADFQANQDAKFVSVIGSLVAFLIGVLFADVWISFIEWLAPLLI